MIFCKIAVEELTNKIHTKITISPETICFQV